MAYLSPAILLAFITLALLFGFFFFYWHAARPRPGTVEWIQRAPVGPISFTLPCVPLSRKDALPMLLITAVYAVTAFWHLGSAQAPQNPCQLAGTSVTVTLEQECYLSKFRYFPNLGTGSYQLEVSSDGQRWLSLWSRTEDGQTAYYWADGAGYSPSYAMSQSYDQLFKWVEIAPENPQYVRFLRITGRADRGLLELGELALFDQDGSLVGLSGAAFSDGASPLFDEQDTVPDALSYYNSAYFDEIYHPRTALEHIRGIAPYEISHPPLGKLIIGLGIRLFGMTPFGWRFMGTLFGVLMLPLLYAFLKNMFGKTALAACGTALFAADFMHLTQTRLATIDTYGVFFILAMYYFLYRWLSQAPGLPFRRGAPWLFLSGLMWGLGAASKWTVLYGGVGLALLFFLGLGFKLRDWPERERHSRLSWTAATLLFCVLCFVLIPMVLYFASYLPYAQAAGVDLSLSNTLRGAAESLPTLVKNLWGHFTAGEDFQSTPIPTDSLSGIVANNQWYMLTYHQGVTSSHPYESKWWMWMLDGRPILYYMVNTETTVTRFAALSNPVVCWGGLLAVASAAVQIVRRRSGRALFIVVGYLSQLLPWVFIRRCTFAYHYFPSILFLVLAIVFVFDELSEFRPGSWKRPVYAFTGGAAALYALFYPVLTGITIPTWYATNLLRWLPSWPF